jgi:hypothetical protein
MRLQTALWDGYTARCGVPELGQRALAGHDIGDNAGTIAVRAAAAAACCAADGCPVAAVQHY